MRRHRVYVRDLSGGRVAVVGGEALHLAQVLRVAPGAAVRAFDGRGLEAEGTVVAVEPGRVLLELAEPRAGGSEAEVAVTVAVALLKGDKLAEVVRRCTELGAARFAPLVTRRCDVRALSANKLERLRRVALEAAKQSGRTVVPEVAEPLPLAAWQGDGELLLAHPGGPPLAALELDLPAALTIVTGPEGGFSLEEVAELQDRGARAVGLGPRILRAETAPVALLAALLLPGGA